MKKSVKNSIFIGSGIVFLIGSNILTGYTTYKLEKEKKFNKSNMKYIIKKYIPSLLTILASVFSFGYSEYNSRKVESTLTAGLMCNSINKLKKMDEEEINELEDSDEEVLFFDFKNLTYFRAPFNKIVQRVEMEDGMECYIIDVDE